MLHKLLEAGSKTVRRAVAGVVDQIDGAGPGHVMNCGAKDENDGADEHAHNVVLQIVPELSKIVGTGVAGL